MLGAVGHGGLNWQLALPFGAAALLALLVGRRLATKLAPPLLRRGFATVALLVAMLLIARVLGWLPGPAQAP